MVFPVPVGHQLQDLENDAQAITVQHSTGMVATVTQAGPQSQARLQCHPYGPESRQVLAQTLPQKRPWDKHHWKALLPGHGLSARPHWPCAWHCCRLPRLRTYG